MVRGVLWWFVVVLWWSLGGVVADPTFAAVSDLFVEVVQICFRGCCLGFHGFQI